MYKLIRKLLFLLPPEEVHYFSMNFFRLICLPGISSLTRAIFRPASSPQTISHIPFRNPIGLGAGFDKNALYLNELDCLGFGFVEIGTVTPLAQEGNPKPRLFRLPKDEALINRMGFNNDGVKIVATRLKRYREQFPQSTMVIGGNIGKNKVTPNEEAWKDYETCFKELHPWVDYFVVNVSSPNTPGLRELQEKPSLSKILLHLQMINNAKAKAKPIFLKIAPDLSTEQLDDVIDLAMEIKLDGIVATNTTTSREGLRVESNQMAMQAGGLSGRPLKKKSTETLKYICQKVNGQFPVIASGGIFTAADANEKLEAGASLLQVWTGFIYEGPAIVKKICRDLKYDK